MSNSGLAAHPVSSTSSGIGEIVALAELICNAVTDLRDEYAVQSMPSLKSTDTWPFDAPETRPAKVSKAVRTIEAACAQLSFTVANPGHVFVNKCYGFQEPTCMLVAADAKIADHLLDKPEGVHVDELAGKTGIDSQKLAHVLRFLATKHCFTEVKPNIFANNRISLKLISTDPLSSFLGHVADEGMKGCCLLNENLSDPQTTSSVDPNGSAFKRAHGCSLFDYLSGPGQEERSARFARAMVGWGEVTGKAMLPKVYPWASLPAGTVICDVGGGNGHATVELLKAFPLLKFVVQDLPGVIDQGKKFIRAEITDPNLRKRVEYVPLNFFEGIPVQECDFYYVRHVLHDWPDPACQQILGSIRKAMKPSSRLLINEFVLQSLVRDSAYDQILDRAPEPLLPNYGMGNIRAYAQDITMMAFLNSKERTLQEFIDLGVRSGFKFVKLWDESEVGLLEFEIMPV
ncbi:S-adenosyl-L-methionine-dependent methyltransferase [Mycena sp. CBHHK59/15]|nr:S-adenosyl-L-methionine-dependent methyltransferase [Mycena sp. CBHHK59/15]